MALHPIDWLIVGAYVIFALAVGMIYEKKAGKNVDQYFLSGRSLPWWIAGTSMVATSFAADTPLLIAGWVRDHGIWKNWLWWCYCGGGMLAVFVFARGWRRGGVMTKAEVAELRYGGEAATFLRGLLGLMHATLTNTITLCWVLIAAVKIMSVLLGLDETVSIILACAIALVYSLLAGFWGVVITDLVQFVMAITGALALAVLSWNAVGGTDGVLAAAELGAPFSADTLRFFPTPGDGNLFDASFWTTPIAAFCVYLGVSWWAVENVDGSGTTVQRIAASKNEREGVLATMWFNVAHYALRPWPWIMVGLASLVVLPKLTVTSTVDGVVSGISEEGYEISVIAANGELASYSLLTPDSSEDWFPRWRVEEEDQIEVGEVLARTDPERAYVVMMKRYLPVGLLGLVVASLLAAFMSTIDTHVNLAASYFVNDLYQRFLRPHESAAHYVKAARFASAGVLALAGLMATQFSSISSLFIFFLALLSGVGPIYVMRWLWWRITAMTEIVAMLSSASATIAITVSDIHWSLGPFSNGGALTGEGRLVIVVLISLTCSMLATFLMPKPDPRQLVNFYRKVRPAGFWGPVAELAPEVIPERGGWTVFAGVIGGIALVYGMMLAIGLQLLHRSTQAAGCAAVSVVGAFAVNYALRQQAQTKEQLDAQSDGGAAS
ncbi:MAG: SSS family solute:Na+ symporter [Planctomycetota bacterium]|jgi:SSS family solute:Na+ symporter